MYGKIFQSLYQGTLCGHAAEILVFTNLLAFKDKDQFVDKHPRVIAFEVGLSEDEVRVALANLEGPDPDSRTPDEGGARIRRADAHRDWGWFVINGGKYDAIRNAEERRIQNAEAQRRKRQRDSHQSSALSQQPSAPSAPVSVSGSGSPPTPFGGKDQFMVTIESWFKRRVKTPWSEKERRAFKNIGQIVPEDLSLMAKRYTSTAPDTVKYRRKDLLTLLNNWNGELDRARIGSNKNGLI